MVTLLGGCLSGDSETDSSSGAETSGSQSVNSHPAAANITAQPQLGSLDTAHHTIIAFKDPSCPRCRAFKQSTLPEIKSKLISPNKAAYVLRNYPVMQAWGEPATQALEATFDRSEPVYWELERYYYTVQDELTMDNILEKTHAFLDANTDLTASDVISDIETDAYTDAISDDKAAGEEANIGSTTPGVLLFREDEYVTTVTGSVSYDLIATALGED